MTFTDILPKVLNICAKRCKSESLKAACAAYECFVWHGRQVRERSRGLLPQISAGAFLCVLFSAYRCCATPAFRCYATPVPAPVTVPVTVTAPVPGIVYGLLYGLAQNRILKPDYRQRIYQTLSKGYGIGFGIPFLKRAGFCEKR